MANIEYKLPDPYPGIAENIHPENREGEFLKLWNSFSLDEVTKLPQLEMTQKLKEKARANDMEPAPYISLLLHNYAYGYARHQTGLYDQELCVNPIDAGIRMIDALKLLGEITGPNVIEEYRRRIGGHLDGLIEKQFNVQRSPIRAT